MVATELISIERIDEALIHLFYPPVTASPWAVLCCRFADDTDPLPPLGHYQQLFTGTGRGTLNMVDFFSDVSHGQLDLSGSQVFGWFAIPKNKADYVGNAPAPAGKLNRNDLVNLCHQTAADDGVDFSKFAGYVISMHGSVDLFGYVGGMAAFCDSNSLQPSLLGQEMGHGYGLDHSRRDGSTADYQDPWDVMSTAGPFEAPNADYQWVGPGLNAANMRGRGWLDESRVWKSSSLAYDATIQLRPVHRRDLAGFLAAELGGFLVEFRVKERWDAAIPQACVLVHSLSDNHSYVVQGTSGNYDLAAGDSFQQGFESFPYAVYARLDVVSIDETARTATVRLVFRPAQPLPHFEIVGRIFGGVAVDGGGFIIVGGRVIPVPPRGPAMEILKQLETYISVREAEDLSAQMAVQRAALTGIARQAVGELRALQPLRTPAPRQLTGDGKRPE
jgi:hypothetical protein